jgi:glyoxylase I family protein
MPRGFINHLDLTVSNLPRSIAFYDLLLGELGYQRSELYAGGVPCWLIRDSDRHEFSIGLHVAKSDRIHDRYSTGLHHLAFHAASRSDVDRCYKLALDNNVTILDSPAEYDYTPGYYAVFFADPDGMKLEVVYESRFDTPAR